MILLGDCAFTGDDKIQCMLLLSNDEVIPVEELNQFKEDESLCSVSREDLETRLFKSFNMKISDLEVMIQRKLSLNDCVRLSHYAIKLANSKVKGGDKRQAERSAPSEAKKSRKSDDDVS